MTKRIQIRSITERYKQGDRVQFEDLDTEVIGRWIDTIHLVAESNETYSDKVKTPCGIFRFVTYARAKRKAATCLECIAALTD